MHDLLTEPLLSWRARDGAVGRTTLPGLLARLGDGTCADFPKTRAHQHHPWAMLLTQLAAHALRRAGLSDPVQSEGRWGELLAELTPDQLEAWHLVVEDLSKPAFMQAPVPEGALVKRSKSEGKKAKEPEPWPAVDHPDDLDMLVTSKSHDVKQAMIAGDDVEAWIYALVTVQTMQGFPGRGYNGIARMKGGYGSRPRVGLASGLSTDARFARDVRVLLETWSELVEARGHADDGVALTWLVPWDGARSLPVGGLVPHFVEICQRLRLERSGEALLARRTTSEARRCAPEVDGGDVGDAWIPVSTDDGGAFTVSRQGFSYQRFTQLLFGDGYAAAPAQALRADDPQEVYFLASALARGQGKTEGLHERALRLSTRVRRRLGDVVAKSSLASRAKERVGRAELVRSKVLYPALSTLGDARPTRSFDGRVDEIFFGDLFAQAEEDDAVARLAWDRRLLQLARAELEAAIDASPLPDARRYRLITTAHGLFEGCARKHCPDAWAELTARPGVAMDGRGEEQSNV